jgi:hypothetical protein
VRRGERMGVSMCMAISLSRRTARAATDDAERGARARNSNGRGKGRRARCVRRGQRMGDVDACGNELPLMTQMRGARPQGE